MDGAVCTLDSSIIPYCAGPWLFCRQHLGSARRRLNGSVALRTISSNARQAWRLSGILILVWAVCNTGIYSLQSLSHWRPLLHSSPCHACLSISSLLLASLPCSILSSFFSVFLIPLLHMSMLYSSDLILPALYLLLSLKILFVFAFSNSCSLIFGSMHDTVRISSGNPIRIKRSRHGHPLQI